jgi:hypothetical protein
LYGIPQEDFDQLCAIFMTFDQDDSGELDREELTRIARWLNFAQQPGDIDRMFREMDVDRSGALSRDEFCTWLSRNKPNPESLYNMKSSDYNCVMMQFRTYDRNQDGCLTLEEFQRLCASTKMYPSMQQAAEVFRQIDLDHSGTIDLHEFLTFRSRRSSSGMR